MLIRAIAQLLYIHLLFQNRTNNFQILFVFILRRPAQFAKRMWNIIIYKDPYCPAWSGNLHINGLKNLLQLINFSDCEGNTSC